MDEKTEELRDIFMDVSEEGTVTESQAETRGSLATDEEGVEEDVAAVVDRLRDRFPFETDRSTEEYVAVVRGFYEGEADEAVAADLGVSTETVFRMRMDLHLVREADAEAPFDLDLLREGGDDELAADGDEALATDLAGEDEVTVGADEIRRLRRVVRAQDRARTVSHRFQSEFEDAFAEAGIATTMTDSVRQDGLDEATEDIDSLESDADVSF